MYIDWKRSVYFGEIVKVNLLVTDHRSDQYTFSAEHAQSRETSRSRVTSNRRRFRGVTLR